jgi:hypothetical protein
MIGDGICESNRYYEGSDVEKLLYGYNLPVRTCEITYFELDGISNLVEHVAENMENTVFSSPSIIQVSDQHQSRYHRGLKLRVWLNNKNNSTQN